MTDRSIQGVVLRPAQRECLHAHAPEAYPHECCGFLVGDRADGRLVVARLVRATNAHEEAPRTRYRIPPEEFVRVQRAADREGLDIVGFYHSHPEHEARPSSYDRDHAWPHYVYLILSVRRGEPGPLGGFVLAEDGSAFRSIEVIAGEEEP